MSVTTSPANPGLYTLEQLSLCIYWLLYGLLPHARLHLLQEWHIPSSVTFSTPTRRKEGDLSYFPDVYLEAVLKNNKLSF